MNKEIWVQTGIEGLAPTVPVEQSTPEPIIRKQLAYYIRHVCNTNKVGFAELIGVSPATITKWLHTTTLPSIELCAKFARRTGLELDEVLDYFREGLSL